MPRQGTPAFPRGLREFSLRFAADEECAAYLFAVRYPDGYVCQKCGSRKAWKVDDLYTHICENHHRISITAGTVMHRTRQPLTTWFHAAYLVSTLTPGVSALQFQRQLGIEHYEVAFNLLHKLRSGLVAQDRELLHKEVEVDETYITSKRREKIIIIGTCEVVRWKDEATDTQRERAGRIRLRVIPDETALTFLDFVAHNIDHGAIVHTDGDPSYNGLVALGYKHRPVVQALLVHVHRVFSNLKTWLMGTHHGAVRTQHYQAYLNEYAFRFNRRGNPWAAFNRALGLAVTAESWPTYASLYAAGERGGWVHPNPRQDETLRARLADLAEAEGMGTLAAWMDRHADEVRTALRRAMDPRKRVLA